MEANNERTNTTVKEEPLEAGDDLKDPVFTVDCIEVSSNQDKVLGDNDGHPHSKANTSVKTEPSDNLGASETRSANTAVEEEEVYVAKCELICHAENEEEDPKPELGSTAVSKAADNFEFISVGAIKQEKPEWTLDPVDANPLQETGDGDLKQDLDPNSHSNPRNSGSEDLETGSMDDMHHRSLEVHMRTNDAHEPFHCGDSKIQLKTKSELVRDRLTHKGGIPYECRVCSIHFSCVSKFKKHERLHMGDKPYQCGVCNKHFGQLVNLKTHEVIHTGGKPYRCGLCRNAYKTKCELETHARVHTGGSLCTTEKPYQCGVCNKQFGQLVNLKTHEVIHTGEYPYQCGLCKNAYKTKCRLQAHERVHMEEKPYQCRVCNKQFGQLVNLKTHEVIHTGEYPYQCGLCKNAYKTKCGLQAHERVHAGEKPYHC